MLEVVSRLWIGREQMLETFCTEFGEVLSRVCCGCVSVHCVLVCVCCVCGLVVLCLRCLCLWCVCGVFAVFVFVIVSYAVSHEYRRSIAQCQIA